MTSLADQLPPDIAGPDSPRLAEERSPLTRANATALLAEYQGKWIAFAEGAVVASATTPLEVFLAIQNSPLHPYVVRVGHEGEPWYRIRRESFLYDRSYPGTPLPVVSVEFRPVSGSAGVLLDRVIPDTGADTTTLPWSDCQRVNLSPAAGIPA